MDTMSVRRDRAEPDDHDPGGYWRSPTTIAAGLVLALVAGAGLWLHATRDDSGPAAATAGGCTPARRRHDDPDRRAADAVDQRSRHLAGHLARGGPGEAGPAGRVVLLRPLPGRGAAGAAGTSATGWR